jgi:hypothetical protein
MADAIGRQDLPLTLEMEISGDQVRMLFFGFETGESPREYGFGPLEYGGFVTPRGKIHATVPTSLIGFLRMDPWGDCGIDFTSEGGALEGRLSADGRSVSGSIVESFRYVGFEGAFTVNSRFEATRP